MRFLAVRGRGDPNEPDGAYQTALGLLYGVAYTLKMSGKGSHPIDGYFPYVVPPLEGLWRQSGGGAIDYAHKENFLWTALIRVPEFVSREEFSWAVREASEKKQRDFSAVEYLVWKEGLCVQCMHIGSYDSEPDTIARMDAFLAEKGFQTDFSETRRHHEIYLSDPRRTSPEKLRTVIRHPIRTITAASSTDKTA